MANNKTPIFRSDDAYDNLRNAIVLQAVKDYRRVIRRLKRKPRNKKARREKAELEQFFLSAWYESLTAIDGEMIIEILQKEGGRKT